MKTIKITGFVSFMIQLLACFVAIINLRDLYENIITNPLRSFILLLPQYIGFTFMIVRPKDHVAFPITTVERLMILISLMFIVAAQLWFIVMGIIFRDLMTIITMLILGIVNICITISFMRTLSKGQ